MKPLELGLRTSEETAKLVVALTSHVAVSWIRRSFQFDSAKTQVMRQVRCARFVKRPLEPKIKNKLTGTGTGCEQSQFVSSHIVAPGASLGFFSVPRPLVQTLHTKGGVRMHVHLHVHQPSVLNIAETTTTRTLTMSQNVCFARGENRFCFEVRSTPTARRASTGSSRSAIPPM